MREIITSKTVYSWEDVVNTPNLLEKAIAKNRDINTGMGDDWWSMTYDDWTEKLEALGYRDIDIRFSGFWSQGYGASFTGEVDVLDWIKNNDADNKYKRLENLINNNVIDVLSNDIKRHGRYVHECSTSLNLSLNYRLGACVNYNNIDRLIESLEGDISTQIKHINQDIYNDLRTSYDYLESDQAVVDTLAANEYEFDSEGNIF